MKLYYLPGSCSLAAHIILHELNLPHEAIRVDRATKRTQDNQDFLAINPKGYVPALVLADGKTLTEGPAILQYLAAQKPQSGLSPQNGSFEQAKLQEWLNYIATELHKNYGPLFNPKATAEEKQAATERLGLRLRYAEQQLGKTAYICSDSFSIADAYLYVVLSWAEIAGFSLAPFPALAQYRARLAERPSVLAARKMEGLK